MSFEIRLHLWCFAKKTILDIGCDDCSCLVCSRLQK